MRQIVFIDNHKHLLVDRLRLHLENSREAKIAVSYIRNSGINHLIKNFEKFAEQGGELTVLTSAQMGITEREAIRSLLEIGARVAVFANDANKVFHAKTLLFKQNNGKNVVIVGSANLSNSGLLNGVEWGIEIRGDADLAREIDEEFERLLLSSNVVLASEENVEQLFQEASKATIPFLDIEDGYVGRYIRKNLSMEDLQKEHTLYEIHKRPDALPSWNFNLSVNKVNKLLQTNDLFYVVFHCDYEAETEMVFAIPSDYLVANILPYAHKTNGTRYLINVSKSTLTFNWQRSIKMDGRPFLVGVATQDGND